MPWSYSTGSRASFPAASAIASAMAAHRTDLSGSCSITTVESSTAKLRVAMRTESRDCISG